ncbi:hypothetical protein BC628DRAFT_991170 [Trametes gibbosa]|nr:hypothetical protein BC628DRAFT_991170 [Trametes gibbosa]
MISSILFSSTIPQATFHAPNLKRPHVSYHEPPLWTPAPPPATKLGRQLRLSRFAGVHVSPGRFECNSEHLRQVERAQDGRAGQREQLCAAFHAATGNFINTAYKSQHESLEAFIGEVCGCAGESVVATKAGSTRRLVLSGKGGVVSGGC